MKHYIYVLCGLQREVAGEDDEQTKCRTMTPELRVDVQIPALGLDIESTSIKVRERL